MIEILCLVKEESYDLVVEDFHSNIYPEGLFCEGNVA